MTNSPRCVVDTNVHISALLSAESTSNRTIDTVRRHGVLLSSDETFTELKVSLRRSKFNPYLQADDREQYLALIQGASEFVEVTEHIEACRARMIISF